ncbi:hypothetical protein HNY73_007388 [Argiope bruennichi]|uniref:Uncharacterized protein n=1 Tax=Argiope bruennichi TaxID=94029 RepID=A0A8T0FER1_ARGBR|nr:hypothetical protein HNY73_007388 [Argiope bruennichi]
MLLPCTTLRKRVSNLQRCTQRSSKTGLVSPPTHCTNASEIGSAVYKEPQNYTLLPCITLRGTSMKSAALYTKMFQTGLVHLIQHCTNASEISSAVYKDPPKPYAPAMYNPTRTSIKSAAFCTQDLPNRIVIPPTTPHERI